MGLGNIELLTESFTCLVSVRLEVWPAAGYNVKLLFQSQLTS